MGLLMALGSTNPAKVSAVRHAVVQVWPDARLCPIRVDSGVSAMPMSDREGALGASRRASRAREALDADMGIGLEGAAVDADGGMFLTNWVAVIDRDGQQSLANGGRLPLPESIAQELRDGCELGPVIDRHSGQRDSKEHQGASGYLTRGLVSREQAFLLAVGFALAPFLRPRLYRRP